MKQFGYVPALDGVRGVAIIAVVAYHYFGEPTGGFFGVDLFFVLSGFLITTLLLEEYERTGSVRLSDFYRRRARRLFPALFALLCVLAILTVPGRPVFGLEQLAAFGLYAGNFVRAYDYSFLHAPLGMCWSLAEEEQFYLVWPLALILLLPRMRASRIMRWLAVAFVALAAWRFALTVSGTVSDTVAYYRPDLHADGLVIGCLLAFLHRTGARVPARAGWSAILLLAAVVTVTPATGGRVFDYGLAGVVLLCAVIVAAAMSPGSFSRALSMRPLVWVGKISYSLYLWHLFVIWFVAGPLIGNNSSALHVRLLELPFAFLLAIGSYYKIERPFRRRLDVGGLEKRRREDGRVYVAAASALDR